MTMYIKYLQLPYKKGKWKTASSRVEELNPEEIKGSLFAAMSRIELL